MYSVSLLPYDYRMLHQTARKKDASLLVAIAIMGILLVTYLFLSFVSVSKDDKLTEIQAENTILEKQIAKLEHLEELSLEVTALLTQTQSAAGTNPSWPDLISVLGNSVPQSVGLNNMSMKYKAETGEAIIQGTALSHQAVADWTKELENVTVIGEIKIKYSSATEQDQNQSVNFELTMSLPVGRGYRLPLEVKGQ